MSDVDILRSSSGGGMGGLVLALCLKKYAPDVRFDIYESARELTEVGAGIGMTPRIWSLIKELGLEDELLTIQGTQEDDGMCFLTTSFARRDLSGHFPREGSSMCFRKGDEKHLVDVAELPNSECSMYPVVDIHT